MTHVLTHDLIATARPEDELKWDMSRGDLELAVHMEQMCKIEGHVLDLAAGGLRNSALFARHDMDVTAVDINTDVLESARASLREQDAQLATRITGVTETVDSFLRCGIQPDYDVVLMSEFPHHAGSREQALETAHLAYGKVRPGGYFWLRTVSTLDDTYGRLERNLKKDPHAPIKCGTEDEHTFQVKCNCSGFEKVEPQTFFDPYDIHDALGLGDANIVYQRLAPTIGYPNIMGGRLHAKPEYAGRQFGYISILAQKTG